MKNKNLIIAGVIAATGLMSMGAMADADAYANTGQMYSDGVVTFEQGSSVKGVNIKQSSPNDSTISSIYLPNNPKFDYGYEEVLLGTYKTDALQNRKITLSIQKSQAQPGRLELQLHDNGYTATGGPGSHCTFGDGDNTLYVDNSYVYTINCL